MKAGFDVCLIEDPADFMAKISKDKKYAGMVWVLKYMRGEVSP